MKLEQFINNIKVDYLVYLRDNYNSLFPGCCHEACNLLCGYINYYFDSSFKHKFIKDVPRPHSYISNEKGTIIDFTSWQYFDYTYGNYEHESGQSLLKLAERYNDFPINKSGRIFINNIINEEALVQICNIIDVECYCTDDIELYPPELFMKYCTNKRAIEIQNKLIHNKIY